MPSPAWPDRTGRPLDRRILAGPTLDAARSLLGARLVAGSRTGRIVEVEAYIGTDDRASHARFGRTARNGIMFGPPGIAYVYLVYGMYDCLNVVTGSDGTAAALLVRAVEPIDGEPAIRAARLERALRRARVGPASAAAELVRAKIDAIPSARLAGGPGLVAASFGLTRADTGLDLLDPASPVRLEAALPTDRKPLIEATPRIGIGYAPEPWRSMPWRFFDATSPAVSRPR